MNYLIKNKSTKALTLNESVDSNGVKKYVFEGVFTPCYKPGMSEKKNRNGRIYDKDEVLRHIAYLRDRIKKEGSILGALDHPDGYFEIKLKDVSHKITDLWYDDAQSAVMGKLELLDTPNGQIAKTLVESGYPLFVSSRAAGTVDSNSHVHIQQMFTYDIVATPGFEEAKLNMVNESVVSFLNESAEASKKVVNLSKSFNIEDMNVSIQEVDESIEYNKMNSDMYQTINEEEVKAPLTSKTTQPSQIDGSDAAAGLGVPTAEVGIVQEDDAEKSEESNQEENKIGDSNIDDASLIEKIEPEFETDIIDITPIFADEEDDEESEKDDEDKEKDKEEDSKSEDDEVEEGEKEELTLSKAEDLKKRNEETLNKYDSLIKEAKTKKEVKESIIANYPFAISMSESNFSKFARLVPVDKEKVAEFIYNNGITDIRSINECWETPLIKERMIQDNWMKLASESDKALYNEAPKEIQDSIAESAKLFILESKAEVEEFWANTGLRQRKQREILNESFVNQYKEMINPIQASPLPYTSKFVEVMTEMVNE